VAKEQTFEKFSLYAVTKQLRKILESQLCSELMYGMQRLQSWLWRNRSHMYEWSEIDYTNRHPELTLEKSFSYENDFSKVGSAVIHTHIWERFLKSQLWMSIYLVNSTSYTHMRTISHKSALQSFIHTYENNFSGVSSGCWFISQLSSELTGCRFI